MTLCLLTPNLKAHPPSLSHPSLLPPSTPLIPTSGPLPSLLPLPDTPFLLISSFTAAQKCSLLPLLASATPRPRCSAALLNFFGSSEWQEVPHMLGSMSVTPTGLRGRCAKAGRGCRRGLILNS